jgi:hypothetical protein
MYIFRQQRSFGALPKIIGGDAIKLARKGGLLNPRNLGKSEISDLMANLQREAISSSRVANRLTPTIDKINRYALTDLRHGGSMSEVLAKRKNYLEDVAKQNRDYLNGYVF